MVIIIIIVITIIIIIIIIINNVFITVFFKGYKAPIIFTAWGSSGTKMLK